MAYSHGEILAENIDVKRTPAVHGKTLSVAGILRKVFKDSECGVHSEDSNVFESGGGNSTNSDVVIVTASVLLEEQRAAIAKRVEEGGSICVLHWELDGTPQRMSFQCSSTPELLSRGQKDTERASSGCRDVLVQKGVFIAPDYSEDIFVKPRVLGDQTSATLLECVMKEMAATGVDLQRLSQQFDEVLLHFGIDGAATCELTVNYIKCLVIELQNIIVLDSSPCLLHAINRICADHTLRSRLGLGGLFSLTKLMYIGSYFDAFCKAVVAQALDTFHWDQFGGALPGLAVLHERLVRAAIPDLHLKPEHERKVLGALRVLNGQWDKHEVAHHFVIDPMGFPCCSNKQEAKDKTRQSLEHLLFSDIRSCLAPRDGSKSWRAKGGGD